MTNEQFRALCDAVLLPRFSDLLHEQLKDLRDTLDIFADELARMGLKLDAVVEAVEAQQDEDDR